MILDERLEFADAATATGATGYHLIGDVVDLGAVPGDPGQFAELYCLVQVTTQFDSSGDGASAQFILASNASATFGEDGTDTAHGATPVTAEATLAPGYGMVIKPAMENPVYERYLGLLMLVSGEAVTAGAINAFMTRGPHKWKSYADGQN